MKRRYSQLMSASAQALPAMNDPEQTGARPKPTGSLTDAGTTPLWHSSQLHPTESAMRSTLPSPGHITSLQKAPRPPQSPSTPRTHIHRDSDPMAIDNLIHPTSMFTSEPSADNYMHHSGFTPVNNYNFSRPVKAPLNTASYTFQTGFTPPGMNIDMNQIDSFEYERNGEVIPHVDESMTVDKDDGRVWHLGNEANESYSGTFTKDDPEDYPIEVRHMANCIRKEREGPARMVQVAQLLDQVRTVVSKTQGISIQRTSFVDEGDVLMCERPGCLHQAALPPDSYYVNVGDNYELIFCLRCFELLWGGKFTEAPPPESDPFRRDSAIAFTSSIFDGSGESYRDAPRRSARLNPNATAPVPSLQPNNQLFQSRWAVPEDQAQAHAQIISPLRTPNRHSNTTTANLTDDPMDDSPYSTNTAGEWYHGPTAVQHIAHRLTAGPTLTDIDKAAFVVWQTTSKAQLRWNHHLLYAKMTREYYAGVSPEDEGLRLEKLDLGEDLEWEELEAMEAKIKMRVKDCYGRELSFVLKEAAKNNGKA